jgi:hypothetical protein
MLYKGEYFEQKKDRRFTQTGTGYSLSNKQETNLKN